MPFPRSPRLLAVLAAMLALLCALPVSAQEFPAVVTDTRGKEVTIAAPPQRIVSLAPSATEIVCAVGACDRLVATDGFSDFPPRVNDLPKLGGLQMSAETVLAQQPDLVLAAGITSADLLRLLDELGVPTLVVDAKSLEEVYAGIELVGQVVGSATAPSVVEEMRNRVAAVTARTAGVELRPTVFHELDSHLYSATRDTFIGALIDLAGGQNILASAAVPYPQVSSEYVVMANPDVIVLADAKYGTTPESVAERPGWSSITAVRAGAIYPIDPDLVSRPGPRLAAGLEAYARLLHPELFPAVDSPQAESWPAETAESESPDVPTPPADASHAELQSAATPPAEAPYTEGAVWSGVSVDTLLAMRR